MQSKEMLKEDKEMLTGLAGQRDRLVRIHSKMRVESLKTEHEILKQLGETEERMVYVLNMAATRAGVPNTGWKFNSTNGTWEEEAGAVVEE